MHSYQKRSTVTWMLILLAVVLQGCSYYEGPPSDHFDGERFHNKKAGNGLGDHLKWFWEMETVEWPEWIDDPVQPAPPQKVGRGDLRATFVNQATVLIQMDGINILTDPFWSERGGPTSWMGAKRVRAPGIKLDDLPPIDIILISHDHYDHLDFPTLERIMERHHPVLLTGLGVGKRLDGFDTLKIVELDWWDHYRYSDEIQITFVPAKHSSGRGMFDADKTLWGAFVIESPHGRVLFFGDTAYGDFIEDIRKRYEGFRLGILPIGSYEPYWFMGTEHMNPEDAVRIHRSLNIQTSMGVHFATIAEHPEQTIDAHEKDLSEALEKYDIPASEFLIPGFGEGRDIN